MSSHRNWSWEEMIAAFRALGGSIENIRLGTGPRGRGLFPIDDTKPVHLKLPDNLLFPTDDVEFVGDGIRLKDTASAGAAEREFFDKYEESFSWESVGRAECTAFADALDSLPAEIRALLAADFGVAERIEGDVQDRVRRQFLASRQIGWKDRVVIMPLVELANNGENALTYGIGDDLGLEGMVAGEVLVAYGAHDPRALFFNYGYAGPAIGAFSLPMKTTVGSYQLGIGGDTDRTERLGSYLVPELTRDGSRISLSHLMLGHAPYPAVPRGIFRALTKEIFGENTDEVFDTVRHFNRGKFLHLLAALEPYKGAMIVELEKMARFQLEAISWSFGSLDIYAPVPPSWQETESLRTDPDPAPRSWTWDEMLDAFRGLGGVAENIRLAYGPSGRGLFPAERGRPFRVRVPQNLLVPVADVFFADGKIGIKAEAAIGAPEREFFARYQDAFSWGGAGRSEAAAFIAEVEALPSEVRELLASQLGMADLLKGDAETRAQKRFVQNRTVEWNGSMRIVPLAELAKRRPEGVAYGGADFLEIAGESGGEIFVSHRPADAFQSFRQYGFASPEPGAFCLPMKAKVGQFELGIERKIAPRAVRAPVMPQMRREEGRLVLSFLPLGHPEFPGAPRGIFRTLMRRVDMSDDESDEAFDRILNFNRLKLIKLLEVLAPHDGKLVLTLRKMARFQLEAMSWCVGARPI